jgi:hypothetical protein
LADAKKNSEDLLKQLEASEKNYTERSFDDLKLANQRAMTKSSLYYERIQP